MRLCQKNFVGTFSTNNRNEQGNGLIQRLIRKPEDLIKVVKQSEVLSQLPGNRPVYHDIEDPPSHPLLFDVEKKVANVIYKKIHKEVELSNRYHVTDMDIDIAEDGDDEYMVGLHSASQSNAMSLVVHRNKRRKVRQKGKENTLKIREWNVQCVGRAGADIDDNDNNEPSIHVVRMKLRPVINYFEDNYTSVCTSCSTKEEGEWDICVCCNRWFHLHHKHRELRLKHFEVEDYGKLWICTDCINQPKCYWCSCAIPMAKGYPCRHIFAVRQGVHSRNTKAISLQSIHPNYWLHHDISIDYRLQFSLILGIENNIIGSPCIENSDDFDLIEWRDGDSDSDEMCPEDASSQQLLISLPSKFHTIEFFCIGFVYVGV